MVLIINLLKPAFCVFKINKNNWEKLLEMCENTGKYMPPAI